jgi:carboxymethylenebutenolidase
LEADSVMNTTSETLHIATPDGAMGALLARPEAAGPHPAVLVIMEAFGLNAHIKAVAARIAAEGYVALAPDMYYRETNAVVGYDQLPEAIRLMQGLRDEAIIADIGATIGYLQAQPFVRPDRIGITGFCMGGRISFLSASAVPAIKAAAPFYGGGIGGLLDRAPAITCPLLLFFGDQDPFIPNDEVARIEATLRELGKTAEVKVYRGAPHGFFCNERESYRADAAADAWTRLTAFLAAHLRA